MDKATSKRIGKGNESCKQRRTGDKERGSETQSLTHLLIHQWVRSAIHASQKPNLSYRFPIFETSATALCGPTGIGNIRDNQDFTIKNRDLSW